MKKTCCILIFIIINLSIQAQTIVNRNNDIEKMVKSIDQDSLKSYLAKMVSFGTRNTLSDIKSKTKGIRAARNWVVSKFNQFAKQADGRLTTYLDTTTFKPMVKELINQLFWEMQLPF